MKIYVAVGGVLLAGGADVNAANEDGKTLLMIAAHQGDAAVNAQLMEKRLTKSVDNLRRLLCKQEINVKVFIF